MRKAIKTIAPGMTIKIFFQDESRFGRINDLRRCWAPRGQRPIIGHQIVREFVYVVGAVCPTDGQLVSLVMPWVDTEVMSIFLATASQECFHDHYFMFLDAAAWHTAHELRVPANMTLFFLPPYSPELNPMEHIWDHLRENSFGNRTCASLTEVENILCNGLALLHKDSATVSSLTYFDWFNTLPLMSN